VNAVPYSSISLCSVRNIAKATSNICLPQRVTNICKRLSHETATKG
jgi:hypothetical protein